MMRSSDEQGAVVLTEESDGAETAVTTHRSSPDRIVFTEQGNTEGWIATDQTVELTR